MIVNVLHTLPEIIKDRKLKAEIKNVSKFRKIKLILFLICKAS